MRGGGERRAVTRVSTMSLDRVSDRTAGQRGGTCDPAFALSLSSTRWGEDSISAFHGGTTLRQPHSPCCATPRPGHRRRERLKPDGWLQVLPQCAAEPNGHDVVSVASLCGQTFLPSEVSDKVKLEPRGAWSGGHCVQRTSVHKQQIIGQNASSCGPFSLTWQLKQHRPSSLGGFFDNSLSKAKAPVSSPRE